MKESKFKELAEKITTLLGLGRHKIVWIAYSRLMPSADPRLISVDSFDSHALKTITGLRCNMRDWLNRKRAREYLGVDDSKLPDESNVIGIKTRWQTEREIRKSIVHELTHIVKPPFWKPAELAWSEIHYPAFRKKERLFLKIIKKNL